jgi:hypothetical protein
MATPGRVACLEIWAKEELGHDVRVRNDLDSKYKHEDAVYAALEPLFARKVAVCGTEHNHGGIYEEVDDQCGYGIAPILHDSGCNQSNHSVC